MGSGGTKALVALLALLLLAWLVRAGTDEAPEADPERAGERTYVVAHVIDGDTVDLADGRTVRLAGIDTPEMGECGYDQAAAALEALVLRREVVLVASDEDKDQYGRLLRYLDVRRDGRVVDAGLTLIRRGLAVARYDSRDGYGFHPREDGYVAADRSSADVVCKG